MSNSRSSNRSKKFPPPLHLPISNSTTMTEEEKSTTNCSNQCPHEQTSFTLPVNQRPQILHTLIDTSSTLLFQPSSEPKNKRSHISLNTTQINFLKRQYASRQTPVNETEWIDFIRLVVYKPLEHDLTMLLDRYKTTYFDRMNSPTTSDATIRANLCDMASQILSTYSNSTSKRKREISSTMSLNNQTKFLISSFIPNKFSHLFKYRPNENDEEYLRNQGHLTSISSNKICLMFYDEVINSMTDEDIQTNGISIDHSFTLPETILNRIQTMISSSSE